MVKRLICVLLCLCVMCCAVTALAAWTDKQTKAHEIAELARSMALGEDNPIIKEASRIWWEEENAKNPAPKPAEPTKTYVGTYYITGYDSCYACNGNSTGLTASGTRLTVGRTVAANRSDFAIGTKLYIEGIGYRTVEDRGCASGTIDVLCNNHSECYRITGHYKVYVVG